MLTALKFPGALRMVIGPVDVFRLTEVTSNASAAGDCAVMVRAAQDRATARHTASFMVCSLDCVKQLPPEGGSHERCTRNPVWSSRYPVWLPPSGGRINQDD